MMIDNKFQTTCNKASLKLNMNFLLDNCFFNFDSLSFWQIIGISMSFSSAPFIANLFNYYYENKWLLDTKKRGLQKARLFGNLFCFTEDLAR